MCQLTVRKNHILRRREEKVNHCTLMREIFGGFKCERSRGDMKFICRITRFILNKETMLVEGLKLEAERTRLKSFEVSMVLRIK